MIRLGGKWTSAPLNDLSVVVAQSPFRMSAVGHADPTKRQIIAQLPQLWLRQSRSELEIRELIPD
jgi:hypothetical protein